MQQELLCLGLIGCHESEASAGPGKGTCKEAMRTNYKVGSFKRPFCRDNYDSDVPSDYKWKIEILNKTYEAITAPPHLPAIFSMMSQILACAISGR